MLGSPISFVFETCYTLLYSGMTWLSAGMLKSRLVQQVEAALPYFKDFHKLRFGVMAVLLLHLTSSCSAQARDRYGLFDISGKEIIPCKYRSIEYVGCGFYLAEEMPDERSQPSERDLLSAVSKDLLARIENHRDYSAKVLLFRNGKKVKAPIPSDAVLTGVLLRSREEEFDFKKHRRQKVSERDVIPKDALLTFITRKGFGLCAGTGEILVEPTIHSLKECSNDCLSIDLYSVGSRLHSPRNESISKPIFDKEKTKYVEGLTLIRDNGIVYFSDRSGKKLSPSYLFAQPFNNGIALVGDKAPMWIGFRRHSWDCYFIDKHFKRVSPKYFGASEFHGPYALVTIENSDKQEVGLVDRKFNFKHICFGDRQYAFKSGVWVLYHPVAPTICLNERGKVLFTTPEPARAAIWTKSILAFHSYKSSAWYFYDRKSGHQQPPFNGRTAAFDLGYPPFVMIMKGPEWCAENGILGVDYKWLVKPELCAITISEQDRFIKSIYGKFEREDWLLCDDNRYREFYAFLRKNNPIGMSKSQVEEYLGPGTKQEGDFVLLQNLSVEPDPNVSSYQLNWFGAWCASSTWFAEFRYQNDRVKEWRIYKRTDREGSFWIRS